MLNILVTMPTTPKNKETLTAIAQGCKLEWAEDYTRDQVENAHILFGNVPPELLRGNRKLEWMQTNSAGVEPYLAPGVLPPACRLTNATGAYGLAISEHMLAMHLSLLKKLPRYRDAQNESRWQDLGPVRSMRGSVVLVVGCGNIGGEYAKLCRGMGAYVIGLRRTDLTPAPGVAEMHVIPELDTLLPRADAVAIALPGTAATANLFHKARFAKMKDGAILLNVGRGSIVNTTDLCEALKSGKLLGAGLDVTDPEPLPASHPLWKIPTALLTPHISGGYHLEETREGIVAIFAENLARFLGGKPLKNMVDFSTGYRRLEGKN